MTDLVLPWPGVHARVVPLTDEPSSRPERRRHQSAAARAAALALLRELGEPTQTVPRGPEGQPVWPAGWTGSLAHTERRAVAVVARREHARSLGIDVEPDAPLPGDVATLVARPEEQGGGREVFCAKECVHKAIHPETGAWLEFDEVRIVFDEARAVFVPEPVSDRAIAAFRGFRADGRLWRLDGFLVALLRLT